MPLRSLRSPLTGRWCATGSTWRCRCLRLRGSAVDGSREAVQLVHRALALRRTSLGGTVRRFVGGEMNKRGNSYPRGVTAGHWMNSGRAGPNRAGARGLSVLLLSKMCQNMLVCPVVTSSQRGLCQHRDRSCRRGHFGDLRGDGARCSAGLAVAEQILSALLDRFGGLVIADQLRPNSPGRDGVGVVDLIDVADLIGALWQHELRCAVGQRPQCQTGSPVVYDEVHVGQQLGLWLRGGDPD